MARLYLVRHSIPIIDLSLPAAQWHLSNEGILAARSCAEKMVSSGSNIEVIVSSAEPKARETAQIISEKVGKPFSVVAGLHEHERNGLAFLERSQFEAKIEELFANPAQLVLGEETADHAYERFATALDGIMERYTGREIVVVSHGTVISLFLSRVGGIEPFPFWKRLRMPDLAILSLPDLRLLPV